MKDGQTAFGRTLVLEIFRPGTHNRRMARVLQEPVPYGWLTVFDEHGRYWSTFLVPVDQVVSDLASPTIDVRGLVVSFAFTELSDRCDFWHRGQVRE